ncbi:hypothetical protein POM88_054249 [Heracleum sosnowskyi]|uniref:Protein SCAR n=1 Tax=Heracleum sosnowskyi TaxID=360622 RepID=A0AAD8GMP3_9APIA|nr:hypothetical protein POM88_054249 [Heracleum sosnowskyi]
MIVDIDVAPDLLVFVKLIWLLWKRKSLHHSDSSSTHIPLEEGELLARGTSRGPQMVEIWSTHDELDTRTIMTEENNRTRGNDIPWISRHTSITSQTKVDEPPINTAHAENHILHTFNDSSAQHEQDSCTEKLEDTQISLPHTVISQAEVEPSASSSLHSETSCPVLQPDVVNSVDNAFPSAKKITFDSTDARTECYILKNHLALIFLFAAEIFHDLHEEVMATATRGHGLVVRVKQLETEAPLIEKACLSQTSPSVFFSYADTNWHPSLHTNRNLITGGDLPRFIMDSYEGCRHLPRLFLLDKFDAAGAGACLKRYTDPSFLKVKPSSYGLSSAEIQKEKRSRKSKEKKSSRWRNAGTPKVLPASHAKLQHLLLEDRVEDGVTDPASLVKLKRGLNKVVHEIAYGSSPLELPSIEDEKEIAIKDVNENGYQSDDVASEVDKYMDALATMETEIETDTEYRTKNDIGFVDMEKQGTDFDINDDLIQSQFSDSQSARNSSASEDRNDPVKKGSSSFSYSDTGNTGSKNITVDVDVAAKESPSTKVCEADFVVMEKEKVSTSEELSVSEAYQPPKGDVPDYEIHPRHIYLWRKEKILARGTLREPQMVEIWSTHDELDTRTIKTEENSRTRGNNIPWIYRHSSGTLQIKVDGPPVETAPAENDILDTFNDSSGDLSVVSVNISENILEVIPEKYGDENSLDNVIPAPHEQDSCTEKLEDTQLSLPHTVISQAEVEPSAPSSLDSETKLHSSAA